MEWEKTVKNMLEILYSISETECMCSMQSKDLKQCQRSNSIWILLDQQTYIFFQSVWFEKALLFLYIEVYYLVKQRIFLSNFH